MELNEDPYKQYEIKEGIVFLIELSDAIYTPLRQLKGQSQILEILNCINDLLAEMVITFPNNGVGIYLYNCATTGSKYPKNSGLNKIFSLNDLNSSNMKQLMGVLEDEVEQSNPLKSRFSPIQEPNDNLHTVLKTVLREFQRKPHYNSKKLFWFTNNDRPYLNEKLKDSLRTMISDFEDNYIHITPLFLDTFTDEKQQTPRPFDASLYQNIFLNTNYLKNVSSAGRGDEFGQPKGQFSWSKTTVSSQIRDSIFRLKEVKRVQFACDLILSDGPGIGGQLGCSVKGYTLYNHEVVRQFKKVSTENGQISIVHNDTKQVKSGTNEEIDTGKPEEKAVVYKGIPIKNSGGSAKDNTEKVILLNPEVSEFLRNYSFDHVPKAYGKKNSDVSGLENIQDEDTESQIEFSKAPYLKLLCFRKLHKFSPYFNMKPPLFVAADLSDGLGGSTKEGGYSGSFDTFKSLYQSCVRLEKYAVAFGCTKKNSTPSLYALYPTNIVKKEISTKTPDGFLLFTLPWLSEIRSLPDHMLTENGGRFIPENGEIQPTELVTLYGKLIDHIKPWSSYEPSLLNNPTLHYFYKTIRQEALQLDVEDKDRSLQGNDCSVRKLLEVRKSIDSATDTREIVKFLNQVLNEIEKREAPKRAAEDTNGPAKKKRVESLSEAAVIAMWQNETWENVKVDQLREFMSRYDRIKKATRKADMIANIIEYLESRRR